MADSVKIKIEGDASSYQKTLSGIAKTTASAVKGVTASATGIAAAWTAAGIASVKYNAQIEQLQTSFEVMTGSATKAADVVERLRRMGAETPFEFTDLANTTQMLMQYGFNAESAMQSMSMLGDISQGSAEKMNRIAMAYGQMNSAGKVQLQDIKQMIEAGFNPLMEISERTGESMESLYDRISKGKITVDEITGAMVSATSEGGRFYQSMEKQSQTITGQVSTLKDNLQGLGGSVFEDISETLSTKILPETNNLVERMQEAFQVNGLDGMILELTGMVPELTKTAESAIAKTMTTVSSKIPKYVKNIVSAVPALIRTISGLAPQLADTLFDIGGEAVLQLVSRMPEWGPALLKGAGALALNVAKGVLQIASSALSGITDVLTTDAGEMWDGLVDSTTVEEYKLRVTGNVDISEARSAVETAYADLTAVLNSDLLTDEQVSQITDLIGTDYDTIYAKLKSFGLSDADAGSLASQVTSASETVIAKLNELDIGVDGATVARWIAQADGSAIRLKSALKRAGLDDAQISEVVGVYQDMSEEVSGQMPDVIADIYNALTDGKMENDDAQSLTSKLEEAYNTDLAEVDTWLKTKIGELDANSATYAADVAALEEQAATYRAELTTLHNEMAALVTSLVGQPTAVVEARMAEFANIEARIAEINAQIDETVAKADSAYAKAFDRVRAGATTSNTDVQDALSYAYTNFKLDTQAIEDAAAASKAEADAAWESGLQTEENRKAHLDALNAIEDQKVAELAALEQGYKQQLNSLIAGLMEAYATTEPEALAAITTISEKLNFAEQINAAMESMQTDDDSAVQAAKERIADIMSQLTGEEVLPNEVNYGKAESFVTGLEDSIKEELNQLELLSEDGTNPIVSAFEGMLSSDAFAGLNLDTTELSSRVKIIGNGIGDDVGAGMGEGMKAHDFSGESETMVSNMEADVRNSAGSHSPATRFYPVGSDVAAGVGQGMQQYNFAGDASIMIGGVKTAVKTAMSSGVGQGLGEFDFSGEATAIATSLETATKAAMQTAGKASGRQFSSGLAAGIRSGRSAVVAAATQVAAAAIAAANKKLEINSPSRATMRSGVFFGEGFAQGIRESANNVISAAKMVADKALGGIESAAMFNRRMEVSVPGLSQEIAMANEQSQQPVNLFVNGRQLAKVMAGDTQVAQNNYNRSTALGYGK